MTIATSDGLDVAGIDVAGAKSAYQRTIESYDQALAHPDRDWSKKIRQTAIDPAARGLLADIQLAASSGVHIAGHSEYSATIVGASDTMVELRACVDNRGQDVLDSNGQSVKSGIGGSHSQTATISRSRGGQWFVKTIATNSKESC